MMLRSPQVSPCSRGFTLLELLVVITIIAVLAGLVFSVHGSAVKKSQTVQCASNLRQIGAGVLAYVGENNGEFPMGSGWDVTLSKYIDAGNFETPVKTLHCPADKRPFKTFPRSYTASVVPAAPPAAGDNRGVFGRSVESPPRRLSQLLYPNITIMMTENFNPQNIQGKSPFSTVTGWLGTAAGPRLAGGAYYHGDGTNCLMVDGHIECLSDPEIIANPGIDKWRNGRWQSGF